MSLSCCVSCVFEGAGRAAGPPQTTRLPSNTPPVWLLKRFIYSALKPYHKLFSLPILFFFFSGSLKLILETKSSSIKYMHGFNLN